MASLSTMLPPSVFSFNFCFLSLITAIDGGYTRWTTWTVCSKTCGKGTQLRFRSCTDPPPNGGSRSCDILGKPIQTRKCNLARCKKGRLDERFFFICFRLTLLISMWDFFHKNVDVGHKNSDEIFRICILMICSAQE